ncbi:unnamed protein product, partial [Prorocentrum cordatum]
VSVHVYCCTCWYCPVAKVLPLVRSMRTSCSSICSSCSCFPLVSTFSSRSSAMSRPVPLPSQSVPPFAEVCEGSRCRRVGGFCLGDRDEDDSSSEPERERQHYPIEPDIQQLCLQFGIDAELTQKLNDIMIEDRQKTWEQDMDKLLEVLKGAHTPRALLAIKLKDMEKGVFVGKAKCGEAVRQMARKHRLDKGAATKLEDAMSIREAMGKDVDKDLQLLDEHLAASNKPSALISMKLESLRKGFHVGHCIYSRETLAGNQAHARDLLMQLARGLIAGGKKHTDTTNRRFPGKYG